MKKFLCVLSILVIIIAFVYWILFISVYSANWSLVIRTRNSYESLMLQLKWQDSLMDFLLPGQLTVRQQRDQNDNMFLYRLERARVNELYKVEDDLYMIVSDKNAQKYKFKIKLVGDIVDQNTRHFKLASYDNASGIYLDQTVILKDGVLESLNNIFQGNKLNLYWEDSRSLWRMLNDFQSFGHGWPNKDSIEPIMVVLSL
jgi:hypothetical protein